MPAALLASLFLSLLAAPFANDPLAADRERLCGALIDEFDANDGGFGQEHKEVTAAPIEAVLALSLAHDRRFQGMARRTLDAGRKLIDPRTGGIFRSAAKIDWSAPDREEPLSAQAEALAAYSLGYAADHDPRDLETARGISRYLANALLSPEGAFYSLPTSGKSNRERAISAEDNARAIAALTWFHDATGDLNALERAVRAARFIGVHHPLPEAALPMGMAYLALYRSSADRSWLALAEQSARALTLAKDAAENAQAARFLNLLAHIRGNASDRSLADRALQLALSKIASTAQPELLLAVVELSAEPLHMTVVGAKSDPAALALFQAALAVPVRYARLEWWDPAEGPLPNPDVSLPQKGRAAAYVCTGGVCSLPLHEPAKVLAAALR